MSRIAKEPVIVPQGVEVTLDGQNVTIKSKKGQMVLNVHPLVGVSFENGELRVSQKEDSQESNMQSGTVRALLHNMVVGLDKGFEKTLKLVGVGYRAAMEGTKLNMALGYSHPVIVEPPAGITIAVEANTKISVKGSNKQTVGDVAAFIRSKRPPEVYKGKGVKYEGEYIRRKAGKAGKK